MTTDMFRDAADFERIALDGADVQICYGFLPEERAGRLLHTLIEDTAWRAEEVLVWGKRHPQPRLIAWYGDSSKNYTYSGIAMNPLPWTPPLEGIREEVEDACGDRFNSVLLNYYRNERDSMGLHSDDERELGPRPIIASLSVGEERTFTFKAKKYGVSPISVPLPSGSLLLMKGETQRHWKHGIAKSSRRMGPRVNLTFRQIHPTA